MQPLEATRAVETNEPITQLVGASILHDPEALVQLPVGSDES